LPSPHLINDPRFESLVRPDAELRRLYDQCEWAEGPVWIPDEAALVWSDIPNDRMLRWSERDGVTLFRQPSNYANGNTLDREGRIVTCEHLSNRVSRTERGGTVVGLVDRYEGKRLNSPNDLVVKTDGTIWFTDPPYGILTEREGRVRESEIGANHVYRFDPESGDLTVVGDDFDRPNGIAFSPDERVLYVADSSRERMHIRAFDVSEDGMLSGSRVFVTMEPGTGVSDGFRLDTSGNVWTSAADGIHVLTPEGVLLGKIFVPEKVANCEFGGADRSTLFVTASTSLYAIEVAARGAVRY
jgi:gluconolactonase